MSAKVNANLKVISTCVQFAVLLLLSACVKPMATSSQVLGAGAQDPQTSAARLQFNTAEQNFSPILPDANNRDLAVYACTEWDAALDSHDSTTFNMGFTTPSSGVVRNEMSGSTIKNVSDGFDDSAAWVGTPMVNGELQTVVFMRGGSNVLVGERTILPAVAQLSSAGQTQFNALAQQYAASIADGRGLAKSYITCTASGNTAAIDHPSVISDEFGVLVQDTTLDGVTYSHGTKLTFGSSPLSDGTLSADTVFNDYQLVGHTQLSIFQDGSFSGTTAKALKMTIKGTSYDLAPGVITVDAGGQVVGGTFATPVALPVFGSQSCTFSSVTFFSQLMTAGTFALPCNIACPAVTDSNHSFAANQTLELDDFDAICQPNS